MHTNIQIHAMYLSMAYVMDDDDDGGKEKVSSEPFLYFISAGNHVRFPWVNEKDNSMLSCCRVIQSLTPPPPSPY